VKHFVSGRVYILLVYVDDIIVIGDDFEGIANLKQQLVKEFEIKDLRRLKYFLGIEIAQSMLSTKVCVRSFDGYRHVGL
jgi:hypothetical protein